MLQMSFFFWLRLKCYSFISLATSSGYQYDDPEISPDEDDLDTEEDREFLVSCSIGIVTRIFFLLIPIH